MVLFWCFLQNRKDFTNFIRLVFNEAMPKSIYYCITFGAHDARGGREILKSDITFGLHAGYRKVNMEIFVPGASHEAARTDIEVGGVVGKRICLRRGATLGWLAGLYMYELV